MCLFGRIMFLSTLLPLTGQVKILSSSKSLSPSCLFFSARYSIISKCFAIASRSKVYPLWIRTGSVIMSPEIGQIRLSGTFNSFCVFVYPSLCIISFTELSRGFVAILSFFGTFFTISSLLRELSFFLRSASAASWSLFVFARSLRY